MEKTKADTLAVPLAIKVINVHSPYILSQTADYEKLADETVLLIEAISARLQKSELEIDFTAIQGSLIQP